MRTAKRWAFAAQQIDRPFHTVLFSLFEAVPTLLKLIRVFDLEGHDPNMALMPYSAKAIWRLVVSLSGKAIRQNN
jgi:hypothetical protein